MKKIKDLFAPQSRAMEVLRFVFSGGVCFLIEYAVLIALKELAGMNVVLATPIAFLVSVAVNYLMCVKWVFSGVSETGAGTTIGFAVTSAAGLLLNTLIMWALTALLGEDRILFTAFGLTIRIYMLNKVLATMLVMIWNYFTKRHILKKGAER